MFRSDTICALSTATGKAGIAVIRISGLDAKKVIGSIIPNENIPLARRIQKTIFVRPHNQDIIDHGLYVFFPAPHSFTGEDCFELHLHGGGAIIQSTLDELCKLPNFRLADAGEFSQRGFLNGKFDLTQAESFIDLIDAETEHQRRAALSHSRGTLYRLYKSWHDDLTEIRAYTEACLDFPDEDIPDNLSLQIQKSCVELREKITKHCLTAPQGERLRHGTTVAIIGPSNAGKSSLLNYFIQREVAITSPIAGTTRDSLEYLIDIRGFPVKLIDTAGIQETDDQIEQEGIRRARAHADNADLVILMYDGSQNIDLIENFYKPKDDQPLIILLNKHDLTHNNSEEDKNNNIITSYGRQPCYRISIKTQDGLKDFQDSLEKHLKQLAGNSESPIIMHTRYRESLEKTTAALNRVLSYITDNQKECDLLMIAEELRIGHNSIARIIGKVDVEEILGAIFSRFCIGK